MVFVCCVPGCNNKILGKKSPNLSFHRFPRDPVLKAAWVSACGKRNWVPRSDRTVLCSDHFREQDFNRTYASGVVKLREGVVPTIFPSIDKVYLSGKLRGRVPTNSKGLSGSSAKYGSDGIAKIKVESCGKQESPTEMKNEIQQRKVPGDTKYPSKVSGSSQETVSGNGGRIRKKSWKLLEGEKMEAEWNKQQQLGRPSLRGRRKTLKRNLGRIHTIVPNKIAKTVGGESPKKKVRFNTNSEQIEFSSNNDSSNQDGNVSPVEDSSNDGAGNQTIGVINQAAIAQPTASLIVSTIQPSPTNQTGTSGSEDVRNNAGLNVTPGIGIIQPTTNLIVPTIQPVHTLLQDRKDQAASDDASKSVNNNTGVGVMPTVYQPLFQPLANQLFFVVVPPKPAVVVDNAGGSNGCDNQTVVTGTHDSSKDSNIFIPPQRQDPGGPMDKTKCQLELTLKLKSLTVELAEARMKKKLLVQSIRRLKKKMDKPSGNNKDDEQGGSEEQKSENQLADTLKEKMLTFELSQEMKRIMTLLNTKRQVKDQKKALESDDSCLYSRTGSNTFVVNNNNNISKNGECMGGSPGSEPGSPRVKKKRGRKPGASNVSRPAPRKILPKLDPTLLQLEEKENVRVGSEVDGATGLDESNFVGDSKSDANRRQSSEMDDYLQIDGERNSVGRSVNMNRRTDENWDQLEESEVEEDEASDEDSVVEKTDSIVCPESRCHFRTRTYQALRRHIHQTHSPLSQHSTHRFNTYKEFLRWKTNMEKCGKSSFGLNSTMRKDELGRKGWCVFACQEGVGGDCPSTVEVTLTISQESTITSVEALYHPSHYGHAGTQEASDAQALEEEQETSQHISQQDDNETEEHHLPEEEHESVQDNSQLVATLEDITLPLYTDEDLVVTEPGEGTNPDDDDPEELDDVDTELEIYAEEEADQNVLREICGEAEAEKIRKETQEVDCRLRKIDNAIILPGKGSSGGIRPVVTTDPIKEKILLTLRTAEEMVIKTSTLSEERGLRIVDTLLGVLDQLTEGYSPSSLIPPVVIAPPESQTRMDDLITFHDVKTPPKKSLDHSYC